MSEWHAGWFGDWHLDWFGRDASELVDGYGPSGLTTFVLDMEVGFKVRHSWITDIVPRRNGSEQRISRNDAAKQGYAGSSTLFADKVRDVRAKLARFAASGGTFLLGLQHEAMTLRADANGTTVFVHANALALSDWGSKPGQRVVVARKSGGKTSFVNAVIQSATANSITLDVAPGAIGKVGGYIMPAMAVYLEPKQTFARYPTKAESWKLAARAALTDFAPTLAKLELGPLTGSASLANVVIVSRRFGLIGNTTTLSLLHSGAAPNAGQLTEIDGEVGFLFKAGVTTLGDLATALASSAYVRMTGAWNPVATLQLADQFAPEALSGAADAGAVGTGAAITTYNGDGTARPVWDRELKNEDTAEDSISSGAVIIDHGGAPYGLGTFEEPDWGRSVWLEGEQPDWQWFKLFTWTVKGRQKSFWLPTWRDDLTFVGKAPNTITVSSTDGSDFFAWWPEQREHIQIVENSGTITRAKITAAVDNGNGTVTLTIGTTLATSSVKQVSWLELCRFESDSFDVAWKAGSFEVQTVAHVVQAPGADIATGDAFLDDEMSAEDSQPREFLDITHGTTTHRIACGTRDLAVGADVYGAIPSARGDLGVATVGNPKELSLTLPSDHALVRRYSALGCPPRTITVTLWRKQLRSGEIRVAFTGEIDSMGYDNDGIEATFRIRERASLALLRAVPNAVASRTCQNALYDSGCKVDRNGIGPTVLNFKVPATVLHVNGREVRVDLGHLLRNGDWAKGGELVVTSGTALGEPMTIETQTDLNPGFSAVATLALQAPIYGLKVGDTVDVFAGCDFSIDGPHGCGPKFDNKDNFKGFPQLPARNPHIPTKLVVPEFPDV